MIYQDRFGLLPGGSKDVASKSDLKIGIYVLVSGLSGNNRQFFERKISRRWISQPSGEDGIGLYAHAP